MDTDPTTAVDLALPCLDEEVALPLLLARVPAGWRAIVVDNGSTDRTAEVAAHAGALVVAEPRRGYGAAVQAGLAAARADVVMVLDGDGSIDPADATALVAAVRSGAADLACGVRRPVSAAAWPWHARAGNRLLAAVLSRGLGLRLHDIAPVRAGRRTALLGLGVQDPRFGYPLETLLRARATGWRIAEFDLPYHPRAGGRSKVTGSLRGTVRALRDFAAVLARHRGMLAGDPA